MTRGGAVVSAENPAAGPVSRRKFVLGIMFLGGLRWPPQIFGSSAMSLDYATPGDDMTAAKWFGVGVRLLGLWECLDGLDELVTYGNAAMRLYTPSVTSPNGFLAHAAEHLIAGLFLLFAAANIVAASYAPRGASAKGQSDVP